MYNSQEIASKIKEVAKAKNITLGKMLTDCNLSKNALSSMQSGGFLPRTETLTKIADYLGCSVDYLLGRDQEQEKSLDEQLEGIDFALFGEVKELTEDQKRDILNYVKFVKSRDQKS